MKKVFAGTFAAALLAVGVSAQTTPPQTTPPQTPPMQGAKDVGAKDVKDAGKTMTVTGCLKAGDTPETFMLSDLKWKDDKSVGTTGAATPAAPPMTGTSLKLVGTPSTKLSDHVGHTVEVTGTMADKAMGSAAPADPAAARQTAASAASLNVRNVRMVAATCPAQ